jgi:hypothetical protein
MSNIRALHGLEGDVQFTRVNAFILCMLKLKG